MARAPPVGRPRQGGKGRHKPQYKLQHETIAKELEVVVHLAATNMKSTMERFYKALDRTHYNSKRTTILRWARERDQLKVAVAAGKGGHMKLRGLGIGTILSHDIEMDIVMWVNELRADGIPVSTQMLADKARDVTREAGVGDFRASDKWIDDFKRRHKFSLRSPTRQSQICPADINQVAAAFAAEVEATMRNLGITRVYNADQTAVFFEYVAKKTLNKRGAKTVWVKCSGASKERATVMLLGDSDGNRYTPFIVFKVKPAKSKETQQLNEKDRHGFGTRIWKDISKIHDSTQLEIYGRWNGDLSIMFLKHHFADRPLPREPILLLWDDFSGHWSEKVQCYATAINVVLLKVPPHATSVSQPADLAWNFPLKARLRGFWHADMQEQIEKTRAPDTSFKLVRPTRERICAWIRQAWDQLPTLTIANGFRACGLLPSDDCVAAAALIADLEKLSLLESRAVDEEQDFTLSDLEASV